MKRYSYRYVLVDLDYTPEEVDLERYKEWARKRVKALGNRVKWLAIRGSPSGKLHVTIELENEISDDLVPVYQLALGSDVKRECYNYFRLERGVDINVLFSGKKNNKAAWWFSGRSDVESCLRNMCPGLVEKIELYKKAGIDLLEKPPLKTYSSQWSPQP